MAALAALPLVGCANTPPVDAPVADPVVCLPGPEMTARLVQQYGEVPIGAGLSSEEEVVIHFLSERGTWTLVTAVRDGESCILAAGAGWRLLIPERGEGT